MSKILFINPPSTQDIYLKTNVSAAAPSYPNLTLAALAGGLINDHQVKIIDLDLGLTTVDQLKDEIKSFNPDFAAITAKTVDFPAAVNIAAKIKNAFPGIKTIGGGVHFTARPEEAEKAGCFDFIAVGEGDQTIVELLSSSKPETVPGLIATKKRELIIDLDSLPLPAWHLFDLKKYRNSRVSSRKNPVGHLETSRGCSYLCNYCSKLTFGTRYRIKSVPRVIAEIEYMLKCGFREIHIADDSFTQNLNRAKEICENIIRRGLKFPWSLINGIRVNKVDLEFLKLAKRAGCWQIGFGIESGDQEILNKIGKGSTLAQIKNAVEITNKSGIDSFGFFIFGLSGETESSMQKTIDFAKSLPLNIAKFDICIPYPGTQFFNELEAQGRIKSYDWSKYSCHQTETVLFDHPGLDWKTIEQYYHRAFREFYLRPSYVFRRFKRSLLMGDLLNDFSYFVKSKW